ncbi:MAG TPA: hypothetical protein VKS81_03935, partial [Bacteroidota bacterium]|nr:hypothetical protein [Bacteroidota bacterium]
MTKQNLFFGIALFLFLPFAAHSQQSQQSQQDKQRSVALKSHTPARSPFYYDYDESLGKLWDDFMLVEKANSGDPTAEHTLGLFYLFGKDFTADTIKAAYWIAKAAAHNVIPARYNLAILQNNGWGVPWNPFEAYKNFRYAADHGMPEGEYVYGLLLTDNLTTSRDYAEAYKWIKKANADDFAPAKEVLDEFAKRGILKKIQAEEKQKESQKKSRKSKKSKSSAAADTSAPQPVYIDFNIDSTKGPDNETLLEEALIESRADPESVRVRLHREKIDTLVTASILKSLDSAASAGSPEALTLSGRLFDQGVGVKQDLILASVYYLRAARFDAPWAPMLLWDMVQRLEYFPQLKTKVDANDPAAMYVWAELIFLEMDHQLTDAQAVEFLEKSAAAGYSDAEVDLADRYYSGNKVPQDK